MQERSSIQIVEVSSILLGLLGDEQRHAHLSGICQLDLQCLKVERDALQRNVFPRLRAMCALHGALFQAIDLLWVVSKQAALDQRTMSICLSEIARCQKTSPTPNFVILLGERYGC